MVTSISGSTLNNKQIAQLAVDNGFPASNKQGLTICVAIAQAESSGNTRAVNQNTNGTADKGLWQINDVHNDKLPGQDRFDPNVNAQLMLMISSNGTNWQPWSTYNNGAYQKFMSAAASDVGNTDFKPGDLSNALNPSSLIPGAGAAKEVVNFITALSHPRTWIRAGLILLGGLLIGFGLLMLLKDSSSVKQATKAALMVATKGKAAPVVDKVAS